MERHKRKFFIIGHNPNTIEEAREFLQQGANALEPDIVYAEGQFYVCHSPQDSYDDVPTVEEYLRDLRSLILTEGYNLSLIVWDIKTVNFDPNYFLTVVKEHFPGPPFDEIVMLLTNADDHDFLNQLHNPYPNVGVGVDESDVPPLQLEMIFKNGGHRNYSYADGITTLLSKTGVYENVKQALHCRFTNQPDSFGFIYTWVLTKESSIRKYLNNYVDGIIVDIGSTRVLKDLIANPPYNEVYGLAENGYNPFATVPIPAYKLSVQTKDTFLAGTNARLLFTLTGAAGHRLTSLPFDGREAGALERGRVTSLMLEGMDLGEIKCLEVEALTDGIGADWLPGTITVESTCLQQKLTFIFNGSDEAEWVSLKSGKITKSPAS